ncbi:hypothetical protein LSAT2_023747, partial [Lamellibrachia satsuma]
MASGVNMTCPDCKLQFPSMKLFLKHKEKFCDKSDRNEVISQRSHIKSMLDELAERKSRRNTPWHTEAQGCHNTSHYQPTTNAELDQRSFASSSSMSILLPPDSEESDNDGDSQHLPLVEEKHKEKLRQLKSERRKLAKKKAGEWTSFE